jgi:CheY-like chemotaxis protein
MNIKWIGDALQIGFNFALSKKILHRRGCAMGKRKILIVDDNKGIVLVLRFMLEDEGYEVEVAWNGEEGYLAYLLFDPDLVITDIQMPVRTGIELISLIRSHNPSVRAIYMSGNLAEFKPVLEEEKSKYHACFLPKPFSRSDLIKSISECSGEPC